MVECGDSLGMDEVNRCLYSNNEIKEARNAAPLTDNEPSLDQ
jgi:hypothetical protein